MILSINTNYTPTSTRELVWTSNFTIDNPQKVFGLLLNAKNILKEIEENV